MRSTRSIVIAGAALGAAALLGAAAVPAGVAAASGDDDRDARLQRMKDLRDRQIAERIAYRELMVMQSKAQRERAEAKRQRKNAKRAAAADRRAAFKGNV